MRSTTSHHGRKKGFRCFLLASFWRCSKKSTSSNGESLPPYFIISDVESTMGQQEIQEVPMEIAINTNFRRGTTSRRSSLLEALKSCWRNEYIDTYETKEIETISTSIEEVEMYLHGEENGLISPPPQIAASDSFNSSGSPGSISLPSDIPSAFLSQSLRDPTSKQGGRDLSILDMRYCLDFAPSVPCSSNRAVVQFPIQPETNHYIGEPRQLVLGVTFPHPARTSHQSSPWRPGLEHGASGLNIWNVHTVSRESRKQCNATETYFEPYRISKEESLEDQNLSGLKELETSSVIKTQDGEVSIKHVQSQRSENNCHDAPFDEVEVDLNGIPFDETFGKL